MVWLVFKSTLCKSVQLEVPVTEKVITSEAPKLPKLLSISLAVPDTVAVITPVCPVAPAILFSWVKPLLEVVIELSVKVIATLLGMTQGIKIHRVHDVQEINQALIVFERLFNRWKKSFLVQTE